MRAISITKITPEEWNENFAKNAHLAMFKENIEEEDDIDLALIGVIGGQAAAYSTAKHLGQGALHLYYGGAFEPFRGTPELLQLYKMAIMEYMKISNYLRTFVHQKNVKYLTLALREGFIVTGIRHFKGDVLLELTLDKGEK